MCFAGALLPYECTSFIRAEDEKAECHRNESVGANVSSVTIKKKPVRERERGL